MIARLLVSNSLSEIRKSIQQSLENAGLSKNHPDVLYLENDSKLGIEQSRKIKEHFSFKPYQAIGRAVAIENGATLTIDAQNSLLKTLEELPGEGLFIIGATSENTFLPTVLSRVQIIQLDSFKDNQDFAEVKALLKLDLAGQFEWIEKSKEQRERILPKLISYFREQMHETNGRDNNLSRFLNDLILAEEWSKQNVNIRAILEYLMLKMS